jgi:uroporphyrinogen III methyltransferase/synthase
MKQMIIQIISRGEKEDVFRKVDEEFAISLIFGSIYGAVQRGINENIPDETAAKEKEEIFDFVLHGLYSGFNNIKELPLKGKTIVITRTIEQSQESAVALTNLGANVIIVPTLEIVPPSDWSKFDSVVAHPEKIDFIIFTSVHSVQMFAKRIQEVGALINYNQTKVVAVGNKTSAYCHKNNISVNIVPDRFSSEGVIEALSKYNLKNKVVFIPRSAIGREELPLGLKDLGAIIKSVPVYNVAIPSGDNVKTSLQQLNSSDIDLFIFTSPSTFENFLQIANLKNPFQYFSRFDVAAIGPTTKEAIESRKVKVKILPDEFTINGLTKKIVEYYSNNKEKV